MLQHWTAILLLAALGVGMWAGLMLAKWWRKIPVDPPWVEGDFSELDLQDRRVP